VLEDGRLKEEPVNKRWMFNTALAMVSGGMLGVLVVVLTFPRSRRQR